MTARSIVTPRRKGPTLPPVELVPRVYVVVATVPGGPRKGSAVVIMEDPRRVRKATS